MKIDFSKKQVVEALTLAERVSGKNLPVQSVNGIFVHAGGDGIIVRATNLEVGVEIVLPGKVLQKGSAVIPGAVLLGALAAERADAVVLEQKGGGVRVSGGGGETVIKTYSPDDFPTLPQIDKTKSFTLPSEDFVRGVRSVWYGASASTIKQEYASVYVCVREGNMVFAATDSFRLAEKTIPLKQTISHDPLLIPLRNVSDVVRALEQVGGDVEIRNNNNQVSFVTDSVYITSRLIDGSFPDYKQIIPKEFETEAVMLSRDVQQVLKKTALFSDTFNQVRFSVQPAKKTFAVRAENVDVGSMDDFLSGALSGEAIEVNFNHKYVSDCFQSLATDSVSFSFAGAGKPMLIRGVGDSTFLYIVMPMNR